MILNRILGWRIGLLLLCIFIQPDAIGQEHSHETCHFTTQQDAYWKAHPEAYKAHLKSEKEMQEWIEKYKSKDAVDAGKKYIIPVVFHVFGKNQGGKMVTTELIQEAIRKLNSDFTQRSIGQDQIHPQFKPVLGVLPIEFRLAQVDPDGGVCTGVTFHKVMSGFGHASGYDQQIKKYAWDNKKYMNVYIMHDLYNDGDTNNSGVAWYPSSLMTNDNLARVVYNGAYLASNTSENFRRVLTHEFGHFMNLAHTFQGGCPETNGGDHCNDTPVVDRTHMKVDQLNCLGQLTNTQNFMNYTNDYEMFTKDQVMRMKAALQHPARRPLWQETNLMATGVHDLFVPSMGVSYSTNSFEEDFLNNGAVSTTIDITLLNGLHFIDASLIAATHYTISGIPAGLTPVLNKVSNTKAVLSLKGKALTHDKKSSVSNISLRFEKNAFKEKGQEISSIENNHLSLVFQDPYTQYHYPSSSFRSYAGITQVKFASIDNSSKVTNGTSYFDSHVAVVNQSTSYELMVKMNKHDTAASDSYIIHAWIDTNGDFIFDASEEVVEHVMTFTSADKNGDYVFKQNITIPSDIVKGKKVGLRVFAAFKTRDRATSGYDPQGNYESGEYEDYALTVLPEVATVVPEFSIPNPTILLRHNPTILNLSNSPSSDPIISWYWELEGATPSVFEGKKPKGIIYDKVGRYNVSLEVTTQSGIKKRITKKNAIQVEVNYCTPSTQYATYCGITKVQIGNMTHYSRNWARYTDYHEEKEVTVKAGSEVPFEIMLDKGKAGKADINGVHIWADWDHNSSFDANELIYQKDVSVKNFKKNEYTVSGTIMVPVDAVIETSRIRVMVYYRGESANVIASPCDVIESGEIEDYGLITVPSEQRASVDFSASSTSLVLGDKVQFTDLSRVVNGAKVVSRKWTFDGGTPYQSEEQNPLVIYKNEGLYDVTLDVVLGNGKSLQLKRDNYIESSYRVCEVKEQWGTKYGHIETVNVNEIQHIVPQDQIPAYSDLIISKVVRVRPDGLIKWSCLCSKGESSDNDAIGFKLFLDANRNGFDPDDQIFYDHFQVKDVAEGQIFNGEYMIPADMPNGQIVALRFLAYHEGSYGYKKFDVRPCDRLDSGNGVDIGVIKTDKGSTASVDISFERDLSVYPNPVKNILNILSRMSNLEKIQVFNMEGVMVFSKLCHHKHLKVSMSSLPSGVYMLKVSTSSGEYHQKFIKE
ncbi:T9SS type A sorting domain-containing protein [Halosquirtibacter xylanolyticus]|uniref:M43 family zinc metalloprotease n=1 Tax=Halosquirtibacter xylanolyticus TaxID=3374599 RepID=UPI003749378C|nr:T9SS type A sorting domain-containing protein [Prolixibacteraceae bacterium]